MEQDILADAVILGLGNVEEVGKLDDDAGVVGTAEVVALRVAVYVAQTIIVASL